MKPTIAECRLHVLPLMEAINKAASEWETAPVELLRAMYIVQDGLHDIVVKAIDEDTDRAWRDDPKPRKEVSDD